MCDTRLSTTLRCHHLMVTTIRHPIVAAVDMQMCQCWLIHLEMRVREFIVILWSKSVYLFCFWKRCLYNTYRFCVNLFGRLVLLPICIVNFRVFVICLLWLRCSTLLSRGSLLQGFAYHTIISPCWHPVV